MAPKLTAFCTILCFQAIMALVTNSEFVSYTSIFFKILSFQSVLGPYLVNKVPCLSWTKIRKLELGSWDSQLQCVHNMAYYCSLFRGNIIQEFLLRTTVTCSWLNTWLWWCACMFEFNLLDTYYLKKKYYSEVLVGLSGSGNAWHLTV